jgi:hypothetical protein
MYNKTGKMMMKKYGCLFMVLMATHGTALSMYTRKIMKSASCLQLQRKTMCGTGLKDFDDVTFLRNMSFEKSLRNIENKLAEHDQSLQKLQKILIAKQESNNSYSQYNEQELVSYEINHAFKE